MPETWPDPGNDENGCITWDAPPAGNGWWGRPERLSFENWRDDAWAALSFVGQFGDPDDEIWFTELGCLIPQCQDWIGFMEKFIYFPVAIHEQQ